MKRQNVRLDGLELVVRGSDLNSPWKYAIPRGLEGASPRLCRRQDIASAPLRSMLSIVNLEMDLLVRGERQVKAVSSEEEADGDGTIFRESLTDRYLDRHRMGRIDGKGDRKALHHGKGKRVLVDVVAFDVHVIRMDVYVDLLLGEADNWMKAGQQGE